MAIQVRRGNEADFDASKMLPGEWAVSLDTKYVRMCFSPGLVLRMATYESFEADKAQIKAILADCKDIQSAVQRIHIEVNAKAALTIEYSNSAKESADNAYKDAERAKVYANNAEAVTGVNIATQDRAGLVKGGDNYIAADGTLTLIKETTAFTMPNSYSGRLLIDEIGGLCEQGGSPSPTNPQEIKKSVVSGIKTHGLNFLDMRNAKGGTSAGITATMNVDGSYTYVGTATGADINVWLMGNWKGTPPIFTLPAGKYFIQGVNLYNDGNNVFVSGRGGSTITLNEDTPITGVRVVSAVAGTTYNETHYPIIARSDKRVQWESYKESSATLSKLIELYGIGDVHDVITPKQVKRRIGKVRVSGDWEWKKHGAGLGYYTTQSIGQASMADGTNGIFTHFLTGTLTVDGRAFVGNNTIQVRYDTMADVNALKSWLNSNEVYAYFLLAEETVEELPIADQVALNSLQTYDGVSYIEFDSEIEPTFAGRYGASEVGGVASEAYCDSLINNIVAKEHGDNKNNPHGVTKAQVGLGNVPNVATNDQTPTYTEASTLETLTSGEKVALAFGKIKKAISTLISHIENKKNPHGVTKSDVGLDKVENKTVNKRIVLWTNSDMSAAIENGVTLFSLSTTDIEKYAYFLITFTDSVGDTTSARQVLMARPVAYGNGNNIKLISVIKQGETYHYHERTIAYSYDSQAFKAARCTYLGLDGKVTTDNTKLIPYQIIGIE